MAYEKGEYVENVPGAQGIQIGEPQFREDKVIDPRPRKPQAPKPVAASEGSTAPIGHPDKNKDQRALAPEEPKALTEESVNLPPAASQLLQKEQRVRQREQALKDREKSIEEKLKKAEQFEALQLKLSKKDYSELEKLGIGYEEYTNYLVDKLNGEDPNVQAIRKIDEKVAKLEEDQKKDVDQRFQAAIQQRRDAVKELVSKNEEFSTIREKNQEEAVIQHILDTWEESSIELTPEQAAKEVEEQLVELATEWSGISKLKPKSTEVPAEKILPPLKPGLKTLNNNLAATGALKTPQKPLHSMSDSERYAEARRRAEEKLRQGLR